MRSVYRLFFLNPKILIAGGRQKRLGVAAHALLRLLGIAAAPVAVRVANGGVGGDERVCVSEREREGARESVRERKREREREREREKENAGEREEGQGGREEGREREREKARKEWSEKESEIETERVCVQEREADKERVLFR